MAGELDVCDQCGSSSRSRGVLGLQVCADCGAVRTFEGEIKGVSAAPAPGSESLCPRQPPLCPSQPAALLRVDGLAQHRHYSRALLKNDQTRWQRMQRCKDAIILLADALQLEQSVREPANNLLVRYCQRMGRFPKKGPRLKRLVGACVLAAGIRHGVGITLNEVAMRAGLRSNILQQSIWKLCKVNGIRLQRGEKNAESLLTRICNHFKLQQQRRVIVDMAARILAIANDGWILTGRHWSIGVGAAFVVAVRAFHYIVDLDSLTRMLAISGARIQTRVAEIKRLMLSVLRMLPWGQAVNMRNVHLHLQFVVDFWDILAPLAPELRRRQKEKQSETEALGDAPASGAAKRKACESEVEGPQPLRRKPRLSEPAGAVVDASGDESLQGCDVEVEEPQLLRPGPRSNELANDGTGLAHSKALTPIRRSSRLAAKAAIAKEELDNLLTWDAQDTEQMPR